MCWIQLVILQTQVSEVFEDIGEKKHVGSQVEVVIHAQTPYPEMFPNLAPRGSFGYNLVVTNVLLITWLTKLAKDKKQLT